MLCMLPLFYWNYANLLCRGLCAGGYGWVRIYLSLLPYWELVPWALVAPLPAEPWL